MAATAVALFIWTASPVFSQAPDAHKSAPDRTELERRFADTLSGATLVGQFTASDLKSGKELSEERYTLGQVKKLESGKWLFQARIQYGEFDVTVPLSLPVEWAGDTAIIVVDDLPVPGLGTYTARVMIHDNHYAGYWQGKDHGGHLFGRVEKKGQSDER